MSDPLTHPMRYRPDWPPGSPLPRETTHGGPPEYQGPTDLTLMWNEDDRARLNAVRSRMRNDGVVWGRDYEWMLNRLEEFDRMKVVELANQMVNHECVCYDHDDY